MLTNGAVSFRRGVEGHAVVVALIGAVAAGGAEMEDMAVRQTGRKGDASGSGDAFTADAVQETQIGGSPSYVEVLTCLEMRSRKRRPLGDTP